MNRQCLFAIVLLMLAMLTASARSSDTLNPRTYTSPDGAWTLRVEPHTMKGDRGARYVASQRGVRVWSRDIDFALWEAQITNAGVVAGYAYEHGLDGRGFGKPDTGHSYLYVVIIDDTGRVRLKDERPRHHPPMLSNPPSPYEPRVRGISVHPEADLFILRIPPEFMKSGYTWWRYRLSTGESLGDVVPDQPLSEEEHAFSKEIAAESVHGAPLLCVQWYTWVLQGRKSRDGMCAQAITLDGKEVWRLDLPDEYGEFDDSFNWHFDLVEPGIRQVEVSDRSFSVRSYSLDEKIDYAIRGDVESGWTVEEIGRAPDQLPTGDDLEKMPEPDPAVLEEIGAIALPLPANDGRVSGERPWDRLSELAIGSDGRIYAADTLRDRVLVYDREGVLIDMLLAEADDFSKECQAKRVTIAGTNEVYVERWGMESFGEPPGYVRFDAQGERVGFLRTEFDRVSEEWYFKPGTHERWIVGYHSIALTDAEGKIIRTIEKRPNGDWLEVTRSAAVASDGSLAVIAVPDEWGMRGPATINVFRPDGEPVATLAHHGEWQPYQIAFNGRVAVTCEGRGVQFHSLDGRPTVYSSFPALPEKQEYWYVHFSPEGDELWARNADERQLRRFRLP